MKHDQTEYEKWCEVSMSYETWLSLMEQSDETVAALDARMDAGDFDSDEFWHLFNEDERLTCALGL